MNFCRFFSARVLLWPHFLSVVFGIVNLSSAHALEFGCSVPPSEIPSLGTHLLKKLHSQGKSFPNMLNLQTEFHGKLSSESQRSAQTSGTLEGFYRPSKDAGSTYFMVPILRFELTRAHSVVYICAHADSEPQHEHVTLYFLNGYGLNAHWFSNPFEDFFRPVEMALSSLQVKFFGVGIEDLILFPLLDSLPIIGHITTIPSEILENLNATLGEFLAGSFGAQIQRVVITPEYLELNSDIDLYHPEAASVFFRFWFKENNWESQ